VWRHHDNEKQRKLHEDGARPQSVAQSSWLSPKQGRKKRDDRQDDETLGRRLEH
jgi:hypothetical protein